METRQDWKKTDVQGLRNLALAVDQNQGETLTLQRSVAKPLCLARRLRHQSRGMNTRWRGRFPRGHPVARNSDPQLVLQNQFQLKSKAWQVGAAYSLAIPRFPNHISSLEEL